MNDWNIYFAISNIFFIGMYLHLWEKNHKREIKDKVMEDLKASNEATQPAGDDTGIEYFQNVDASPGNDGEVRLLGRPLVPRKHHLRSAPKDIEDVIVLEKVG